MMRVRSYLFVCVLFVFMCLPACEAWLVVPEDVGTAFAAIYGFTPKIVIGSQRTLGFGWRLGNHADLQIQYQLGPPQAANARSRRARRPLLELILFAGLRHAGGGAPRVDEPR